MLGAMILYSCSCSQKKFEPCHNMNQSEVGQFSSDMLRKAAEYAHFNKQRENNVLSQQLAAMQMGGSSSVQNTPQQQGTLSSSSHGNFFEKNTLKIFLRILQFFSFVYSTPQQTNFGNMVVQSQQYGLPVSQVSFDHKEYHSGNS